MKRNIIIATTQSSTQNLFLNHLSKFLKGKGFNVTLLSRDVENISLKKFNKIKVLFPKNFFGFFNIFRILKEIYKIREINKKYYQPIFLLNTPMASHFIRLSLFFSRSKIIYFVHGYRFHPQSFFFKKFFFMFLEILFSIKTDKYININQHDYNFTKKFLKKNTILVKGIGVNLQKKIKKKITFNSKKKIIGIISRYSLEKGYMDVINLAKILSKRENKIEFRAFGSGNLNFFNQKIKKMKLKNVFFHSFKKDIIKEIKNFDFLLHPSFREGLSVAIIESLSCGIPVVCRKIRGNIDLVRDNYNGILFEDIKEIPNKLTKIINDKKKYNLYSKNAYRTIDIKYSKKFVCQKIFKFIKSE